ncbi:MAG TPA: S8 family serine peptidase, partial [Polyangiaceae bacterium]
APLDETTGAPVSGTSVRSDSFDPGLDWVYLDTNGNGTRDYGVDAGFDETTPAYGEPLFTPDDVNRNGKVDVGERFVRLGTSKFKMIRVSLTYPKKVSGTYTRGTDLIKTPTDITGGALYGFDDAYHATGVSTILAGDLPLVGRRWVGIAPDADLLTSFDVESTGTGLPVQGVAWLLQQKPDVMLHELALWADVPLDGSDQLSTIIDTSVTKDNVIETCPTGDQGSALKHTRSTIAASGTSNLKFTVPEHTMFGSDPLTYVGLSLNVAGGDFASASITLPSSDTLALSNNAQGTLTGGAQYYVTDDTTSRGIHFWNVILYAQAAGSILPTGDFTLNATAGTAPLTLDAYIEDDKSSWAIGAAWDKAIASDAYTVGVPSVADHCIAVGAAPNHVGDAANPWYDLTFYVEYDVPAGYEETQNQVRAYSPRGPRIDGVQKPDILAPDNPWVALNHTSKSTQPYGTYFPFGGTSGASPHVTGVAALLAQAGIKGDAARDAIRKGADHDGSEGTLPNGDYGYGHLNAAKALGVTTDGTTPTVTLTANPSTLPVGAQTQLTATVGGGDNLQVKYDDDYDGTWDTDYAGADPRSVGATAPGVRHFKVRVRNSSGRIAEAVTSVTFTAPTPNGGNDDSGGCGCRTTNDRASTAGSLGLALATLLVLRKKRSAKRSS